MPATPRLAVQAPAPARPGVRSAVLALTLSACCMGGAAAQGARPAADAPLLSSPLPPGLPSGTGAGYHSPASPIAPLPPRTDVLPWSVLADLTRKTTKDGVLPVFSAQQLSMHQTVQRIQGFMVPLDSRAAQTHFLLTSVPLTCPFCLPGGPESMVEVRTRTPVRYAIEPVVVQGRFTLLHNDPYGLYYRVLDAVAVE
ncbi:hypothetical protein [Verminephrobacter aporrectodeae]|uniref:hypothetical protein n=1 Tax=Verminephrobacter aporrectodeae TaxID=1110389 RepID=UPI002237988F|nr:hypothetical protein [Verminephrobacter aporrectodeae]